MALAFYEKVFDFEPRRDGDADGTYYVLKQGEKGRAGLFKAIRARSRRSGRPTCASPTATPPPRKASSLGATVIVPPSDIPGVGRSRCSSIRRARRSRS